MYFGIPVKPTLKNFYAWSPKATTSIPEWIDNCFPNADVENRSIVYTNNPMRRFEMDNDDIIVRCTLGNIVMFLIVNRSMYENWWEVNQKVIDELSEAKAYNFDYNALIDDLK